MFIASREFDNKGVSTWEELDLHFLKWKLQFSNNTENLSNILLASSVYIESGVQYQSRSFFFNYWRYYRVTFFYVLSNLI